MNYKKRILIHTESHLINSGFATMGRNIVSRLHNCGAFEVAEYAAYGDNRDQRLQQCPWRFYGVVPDGSSKQEEEVYRSNPQYHFGALRFEAAVLDFQPDIVFSYLDPWCFNYMYGSPFRKFFHLSIKPAVDGAPQSNAWLSEYMEADSVFTYTDWALELLRRDGGGKINAVGTVSPGADLSVFKPVTNKREHREQFGFPAEYRIIGTVMRNQKRKLYPNLFKDFRAYLNQISPEEAKVTFLYCHTAHPDIGWDIPTFLKENGITHKTFFTYQCKNCSIAFPSLFEGATTCCKNCRQPSAHMPTTADGVNTETLAAIYNLFDIYCQYPTNEGFALPLAEAAACGVPVMCTDYSAPEDVTRKLCGFPVSVLTLNRESETHRNMAVPDQTSFIEILNNYFKLPTALKARKCRETRLACEKHYDYDKNVSILANYFLSLPVYNPERWKMAPDIKQIPNQIPNGLSNEDFVRWCICNILGRPDQLGRTIHTRMLRDLNNGYTCHGYGGMSANEQSMFVEFDKRNQPYTADNVLNECREMREKINYWEAERVKKFGGK